MNRQPSGKYQQLARREFLKTTGAALASLGLSTPTVADSPQARSTVTKSRPVRVGIAGGGGFGNSFHHFKDHPDCEVVAVADLRPLRRARLMKTYQCEISDKGHTARIDICWKGPLIPGHPTRWTGTAMSFYGNNHPFIVHEFADAVKKGRRPAVHVAEALACTAPGIVAHQSALAGGERMKIRHYDPL